MNLIEILILLTYNNMDSDITLEKPDILAVEVMASRLEQLGETLKETLSAILGHEIKPQNEIRQIPPNSQEA